ncbi:MAG: hypothetical protein DI587_14855 [Variovorax paradoxus]|nr:MAG: hypothetical protein DI583_14855 [Variovorax paradoxus]PZQ09684.1 MAG: hypothetical protein DI587_14855 [Variovorax paradoxus]
MSDVAPWFEPGSGWYRIANCAPGSAADVDARTKAAFRCVVFRMRRQGMKLAAAEIAAAPPIAGAVLCRDWGNFPHWHAELLTLPLPGKQLLQMHKVKLVRVRGGFRQYQGTEYDETITHSWPQTWFCAPNEEAGVAVLRKMAGSEAGPG